jgi:DNA (cytosine-5)-methyltransferase 1
VTPGAGLIVDLFAGGAGASTGFALAGFPVDVAVNHDPEALLVHRANHPETFHLGGDVWDVDPVKVTLGRPMRALWASPDCKHFSRAKGSAPRSERVRALAGVVVRWARRVRPPVIFLENVSEFVTWGPLDAEGRPDPAQKGATFRQWVGRLRALGYVVEWRELRACDYGAATSRKRLFLVARCDGEPIVWPAPTHGPGRLLPWRTARDVLDFSLPCPSIFGRRRPLAEKTQARIARGLATHGHHALIQTGYGERPGQAPRSLDLDAPLGTIMAGGNKHALVTAFVAKHFGGHEGPGLPISAPLGAITCIDHHALVVGRSEGAHEAECRAWLARFALELPGVVDIGMRMLSTRELFTAQGFPEGYVIAPVFGGKRLTERAQQRLVGNSVSPPVARALVAANLGTAAALRLVA